MTTSSTTRVPTLPLRAALIGLSASATTSWAARAHLPGLLTPEGKQHYTITALCNSSVDAARAAIKAFDLPADTKAYGNPKDLADDIDIDVVICNTRVDKHFETVVDSVKRGKNIYVEWPVTGSLEQTRELGRLAKQSGAKVAVGLQGRWAPPVEEVKGIVESGRLGKVLSVEVRAFGGTNDRDSVPVGLKYFTEKGVGGNPITIGFGHLIDFVQAAVGELAKGTTRAKVQIQRPKNRILDPETREVVEIVESDVPDLMVLTGDLSESNAVIRGATLSARFRRGQQFKGEPVLSWSVYCEKGEIRLIAQDSAMLQADQYKNPPVIEIHHFANDLVETVEWSWSKTQEEVPPAARSVMRALFAFAEGDETGYPSLESATVRAEQIEAWVEKGEW